MCLPVEEGGIRNLPDVEHARTFLFKSFDLLVTYNSPLTRNLAS